MSNFVIQQVMDKIKTRRV